ncbi:MAG TPA: SDR family oxidoreductase [Streptosporangiaceae bacterium]|nr:SDR family oxidoreductase [Streptosporangiaceae bacterium]
MDLQLAGRVYVVTGGTRGLGFATAQHLVAEGARVVVSGRGADAVSAAVAQLGGSPCALGVVGDNASPEVADSLADMAMSTFGRLDGVLISTGGPPPGQTMDISDEQWLAAFGSVFLGAVRIATKSAGLLESGGVIAFVLSSSVKSPLDRLAVSNGLRPGLAMVAKTLADELGPRGIRVLGLLPGRIATTRTEELDARAPGRREQAEATIPLRRYGEPAEFGRVATFLLSPAASYMTGIVVSVDGGALRCL